MTPDSSPLTPHIAVIGAGYWGKNLVRNFHQLGVLKTICDGAQQIREEMSKTYPDVFITANVSGKMRDCALFSEKDKTGEKNRDDSAFCGSKNEEKPGRLPIFQQGKRGFVPDS
jgi:pyruvate/2-oxoglutarate dehydrogenase complex dihydrolipoamide dehydrogenase (E3) component